MCPRSAKSVPRHPSFGNRWSLRTRGVEHSNGRANDKLKSSTTLCQLQSRYYEHRSHRNSSERESQPVPSTEIDGRVVITTGNWLKIAAVREEELVEGDTVASPNPSFRS